jgi:hypothetical protein
MTPNDFKEKYPFIKTLEISPVETVDFIRHSEVGGYHYKITSEFPYQFTLDFEYKFTRHGELIKDKPIILAFALCDFVKDNLENLT